MMTEKIQKYLDMIDVGVDVLHKAFKYLQYYGYLKENLDEISVEDIVNAVKTFQSLAGLKTDGKIGVKTAKAMDWPRCGCIDIAAQRGGGRPVGIPKWGKKNLRWFIEKRDIDLTKDEWDGAFRLAFKQWADVSGLTFTEVMSKTETDIVISIGSGSRDGFDGPSGTLAWAQLVPSAEFMGQLLSRFDSAETWILNPNQRGILLVNVACHEIGHLLGLDHSRMETALMAPFYNVSITKPQVQDDIPRIQSLYGKNATPTPEPEPEPGPDPVPEPKGETLTVEIEFTGDIKEIRVPGYRVSKMG